MIIPTVGEIHPEARKEAVMGMRVGYTRASSRGQKLDVQMDRLANCERIYSEKASGATAKDQPELQKALDFVRNEDVFVMTMRDRLARSVVDLANIVKGLQVKQVDLVVLEQKIEERVRDYEAPGCSKKEIAEHYGISRSSVTVCMQRTASSVSEK
jgi:DNA invertase Pin-like site-specific DNA recombinase